MAPPRREREMSPRSQIMDLVKPVVRETASPLQDQVALQHHSWQCGSQRFHIVESVFKPMIY